MTSIIAPICIDCTHFHQRGDLKQAPPGLTCDAYPEGILYDILHTRIDHHLPQEGDHGMLFNPVDADAARDARERIVLILGETQGAQPVQKPQHSGDQTHQT